MKTQRRGAGEGGGEERSRRTRREEEQEEEEEQEDEEEQVVVEEKEKRSRELSPGSSVRLQAALSPLHQLLPGIPNVSPFVSSSPHQLQQLPGCCSSPCRMT